MYEVVEQGKSWDTQYFLPVNKSRKMTLNLFQMRTALLFYLRHSHIRFSSAGEEEPYWLYCIFGSDNSF